VKGKVCVVTGASDGIGKETARGLAALGAHVILACRDPIKAEAARSDIFSTTGSSALTILPLDLSSFESINRFVGLLREKFDRLHVLVNNAAALWKARRLTGAGVEATFHTNHLGPFALSLALLDLLKASGPSRVVMVSSKLHVGAPLDLDDLGYERRPYKGFGAYNASKLANVIFAKTLARRLEGSNVSVNSLHPGEAGTAIARDYGRLMVMTMRLIYGSAKRAAKTPVFVATSDEAGKANGAFFKDCRIAPHSPLADDTAVQDRLWTASEAMIRGAR
jgi:NAD(P)-dependent dehydrogenase (short-subunit alcohol dehydrogenase family)